MNCIIYFNWDERRDAVEAYRDMMTTEEVDAILACEDAKVVWRIIKTRNHVELKRIGGHEDRQNT